MEKFKNAIINYQNDDFDYSKTLKINKEESRQFRTITEERPWLKYYSEEVRNAKLPEDTIYGYIKSKNKNELDRVAIEYFGNKLTYQKLIRKIDKCAKSLVALGVKKGDIVTICMPTTPETVYMFYALSKIGAVSNMIDPRKSAKEIEEYANEVNSKIFIGIDMVGEKLKNLKKNTSVENIIIATPYESFASSVSEVLKFKDKLESKKVKLELEKKYKYRMVVKMDLYVQEGKNSVVKYIVDMENPKVKPLIIFSNVDEKIPKIYAGTIEKNFSRLELKDTLSKTISKNYQKIKEKFKEKRFIDTDECISWNDFIKLGKDIVHVKTVKYEKDMPVTIVHTGGTTGKAKGVVLSNDNINCGAFQCEISGLNFKDRGTWLDIMPPFIVYGVGNGLHLPLSMGMKVILMPKFDPTKFDEILLKHKPNYMAGVPSHYGYLLESEKMKDVDLSFIKTPIVGGDKMDYTLEQQVNKFLKEHNCSTKIIKGYGMSEVDAAVSVCINGEINKLKSVGIPLSHSNIGIFDPKTNEELSYNQEGEVRISGPNVMLGYFDNREEEGKILHTDDKGVRWIYSGDLGYFDEDGLLYVKGRYKEMIIRPDGFKVYPTSIEEVILTHPDVSECKVVGCRDFSESQGELPKAFIILKETSKDKNTILKEVEAICHKHLAEYSLPFDYEIKEKFPVTSIGKINTIALKNETEEQLQKQIKQKILKK